MKSQKTKKTVVINQPTYLPWLGYFELLAKADEFVFLDCVQYVHQEWNNRNRIKGDKGKPIWLTVPVKKHHLHTAIKDIEISYRVSNWARKHLNAISSMLGGTPYIKRFLPQLSHIYDVRFNKLCELNIELIKLIARWLDLPATFIRASELSLSSKRTEMLRDICLRLEATDYYSPAGAAAYLEGERHIMEDIGIRIGYQTWEHPIYRQKFGDFVSHMSVLDVIMNVGPKKTRKFIVQKDE